MNRTLIAVGVLFVALPLAGAAQSTVQTASLSAPLSVHDVHNLMKSARSVAEYQQLAGYFHQQEAQYRAEAVAEKAERDRRAQVNAGLSQKYPRPVDSAQYLYESYVSQADNAALEARHYDQLAAGQVDHGRQLAATPEGKS
jgi:hypothetical protein